MCGIAGAINTGLSRDKLEELLHGFERDLHHRGPDDRGFFISKRGDAGLVNTRLAILDLSPAGHQPMQSSDGRYTIVYNGEVYNYAALRAELVAEGYSPRSHSDTEVILEMFIRFGPDSVREFTGMFALAIWDEQERSLFIARGPLGVKPLYYYEDGRQLSFASEVRALLRTNVMPRRLSAQALSGYLLFGAVQDPLTLVEGIRALPAGHYLTWRGGKARLSKFWDMNFGSGEFESRKSKVESRNSGQTDPKSKAVGIVRGALEESVRRHLVSDVPVGVFLSGGIDSTAIVALAAKEKTSELQTFCISFDKPEFNEGNIAAQTAKHFGTQHTDWRLDSGMARGLLGEFVDVSDQPSIDGLNTFCVSKLAHDNGLKVVLSGLGGDELFGGYHSFEIVPPMVRASRMMLPVPFLRAGVGKALHIAPGLSPRFQRLGYFLPDVPITSTAYWAMRGIFTPKEVELLLRRYGCETSPKRSGMNLHVPPQPTLEDEVSYLEMTRYMRNQLLRDSDVMSMAWGLELRVPFVDSRLVDSIQGIPAALRLAKGKRMLLDAVPEMPQWVRERPKQGFTFPFKDWISGEWHDVFQRIEATSPIPLKNWYRTWCLFALQCFIEKNRVA